MAIKELWLNLPVKDIAKSKIFFSPKFTILECNEGCTANSFGKLLFGYLYQFICLVQNYRQNKNWRLYLYFWRSNYINTKLSFNTKIKLLRFGYCDHSSLRKHDVYILLSRSKKIPNPIRNQ